MNTKATIRVIKRGERNRQEVAVSEPTSPSKTTQETARDMVATVTGWVNEFQQRRRNETKQAIKTLFADTAPQTSKA